jgi:excisionase family DNA binding protein
VIDDTGSRPRLLTIAETMAVLHCSRKTLYRLFDAGKLQRTYVGPRAPRVDEAEVEAFRQRAAGQSWAAA